MEKRSPKVKEGWTGPGRKDETIEALRPEDDGLHIDMTKKGSYEWWYFDAHLDSGHTIVVFFHASNPNPGVTGKTGIELVLVRPDGKRIQKFIPYKKTDFNASRQKAEVTIGDNYLRSTHPEYGLPVYEIFIDEPDISCHLTYTARVKGWKPGNGLSQFGNMGYFGWVIPFVRASVTGTVTEGSNTFDATGIGYHDHNWLNFQFPRIIDYWMWGRVYSENYSLSYAYIQCNEKMDNYAVKVLMLAKGKDVILSTGEFEFIQEDFNYDAGANHSYPGKLLIKVKDSLELSLTVKRIMESVDMLTFFKQPLRFIAKYLLRLKPGYFRLISDFELSVTENKKEEKETGTTLHEIVLFKSER